MALVRPCCSELELRSLAVESEEHCCRILVRTDDEELEEQTARSLRRHTSLFSDLGGDDLSSANLAAFEGEERDTAAAVTRQLSVSHQSVCVSLSCASLYVMQLHWTGDYTNAQQRCAALSGILSCRHPFLHYMMSLCDDAEPVAGYFG